MRRCVVLGVCLVLGCSSITPIGGESTGGEGSSESSTSLLDPTTAAPAASSTGSESSSSGGDTDVDGPPGSGFLNPETDTSTQCSTFECSLLDQDCCPGEACKPWANDGGSAWNAVRCTPVPDDAGQSGDPCVAEGSTVSGLDTCDIGLMCFGVDSKTLEGECYDLCVDGDDGPTCADPDRTCLVANEGALPLCLSECDPLQSSCDEGLGCYLAPGSDRFMCIPETVVMPCPEGAIQVDPEGIVGCSEAEPCCAGLCDLSAPQPCAEGSVCVPLPDVANQNLGYCQPEA